MAILSHSLKTGESAFRKAFGTTVFDYLSANPEYETKLFRAMSGISAARIAGLLAAYDSAQNSKDLGQQFTQPSSTTVPKLWFSRSIAGASSPD